MGSDLCQSGFNRFRLVARQRPHHNPRAERDDAKAVTHGGFRKAGLDMDGVAWLEAESPQIAPDKAGFAEG